MPVSLARGCALALLACALSSCGGPEPVRPPHAPQTTGALRAAGLQAPVTVVRDEWGIPHITAASTDDLFFAQGFVQAQDRLFQMDLWKRAAQGHLSEVLGANFIQRDSMTRRIQFRGDYDAEWASYGPDTRRIAAAFTNGINAWVRIARQDLPEEFVLAGWMPALWKPEDLLTRTDAFLASENVLDDLFRARLVAAVGAPRANELFPLPGRGRFAADPEVDVSAITYVVSDAVRRIGTPPFFLTLASKASDAARPSQTRDGATTPDAPAPGRRGSDSRSEPSLRVAGRTWIVDATSSATRSPLVGVSLNSTFSVPSARYLIHLTAPGWNVIGATSPWLPGVVVGHNDRVAWAMTPQPVDTQDMFVERLNPDDPHQVERDGRWVEMTVDYEQLAVNSRDRPVEYERQYTSNGVVIAKDSERHLVYTLRWSGTAPGGAGELGALALNRAASSSAFRDALSHWKMPVAEFVYADADGGLGRQTAGVVPMRAEGAGLLPGPGWSSARTWKGLTQAQGSAEVLPALGIGSVEELRQAQISVLSPGARTVLALLNQIPSDRTSATERSDLLAWEGKFDGRSPQAEAYLQLVAKLRQEIVRGVGLPADLEADAASRIDVASLIATPPRAWFGDRPQRRRDQLIADALTTLAGAASKPAISARALMFEHPLAVFEEARRRFNIGPFPLQGTTDTMLATDGRSGAVLRAIFDVGDWSRSVVALAPGQSGSPASPHYDDLADGWAAGEVIPLLFDHSRLAAGRLDVLTLQP